MSEVTVKMGLLEKQQLFCVLASQWVLRVQALGYGVVYEEGRRTDEQAEINAIGQSGRDRLSFMVEKVFPLLAKKIRNNGKNSGIRNTLHESKLAHDFSLFKDGRYLTNTEQWVEAGLIWESMHPLCRWGGRWGDANHLSMEHNGIK